MSWFGDLFTGPSAQTSGEAADNYARQRAELEQRLAARAAAGTLTPDQAAYYQSNVGELGSTDQAAVQGLGEGAVEGAGNVVNFVTTTVPDTISSTINTAAGAIFRAIPFWLWIVAGLALFAWLGGLNLVKGKLFK